MEFFRDISIRNKHLIILGLVISGLVLTVVISVLELRNINKINQLLLTNQILSSEILALRQAEKDFLSTKSESYLKSFTDQSQSVTHEMTQYREQLAGLGFPTGQVEQLQKHFAEYLSQFDTVVNAQTTIGLDPKSGLYGSLRAAVHEVESMAKAEQEYELLFHMLMLRRNEKDFMLRRDISVNSIKTLVGLITH